MLFAGTDSSVGLFGGNVRQWSEGVFSDLLPGPALVLLTSTQAGLDRAVGAGGWMAKLKDWQSGSFALPMKEISALLIFYQMWFKSCCVFVCSRGIPK